MRIALYLHLDGRAEELIDTYKRIFGAELLLRINYDENTTHMEELLGKIFHAELRMGNFHLYITDSKPKVDDKPFNLIYETASTEEAQDIFSKLSEDGEIIQEIKKMPYGPKIGFLIDKFGFEWDIVITE